MSTKINIEVKTEVKEKAWRLKDALKEKGKKINLSDIYPAMIMVGANAIKENDITDYVPVVN